MRHQKQIVEAISADELAEEKHAYMHFSITKDGFYRCWGGEDHFGKDCHFSLFRRLESFGRHWERNHLGKSLQFKTEEILRTIKEIEEVEQK